MKMKALLCLATTKSNSELYNNINKFSTLSEIIGFSERKKVNKV